MHFSASVIDTFLLRSLGDPIVFSFHLAVGRAFALGLSICGSPAVGDIPIMRLGLSMGSEITIAWPRNPTTFRSGPRSGLPSRRTHTYSPVEQRKRYTTRKALPSSKALLYLRMHSGRSSGWTT